MSTHRCDHRSRTDGVCTLCGHCLHELILNGACYYCATTDLDPISLSPKSAGGIITPDRLHRRKKP